MNSNGLVIRTAPSSAVAFSVMFAALPIAGITTILSSPSNEKWIGLVLCALYPALVYWSCSPEVHLNGKRLVYRKLFSTRSVEVDSLTNVEVVSTPAPLLRLYSSKDSPPFQFPIKPFSQQSVAYVIHYIRMHSPQAEFNALSKEVEQGDITAIARDMLRTRNLVRFVVTVGGIIFVVVFARAIRHWM
jgi:hypothetical protein